MSQTEAYRLVRLALRDGRLSRGPCEAREMPDEVRAVTLAATRLVTTCRRCRAEIALTRYGWGHPEVRHGGDRHRAVPAVREGASGGTHPATPGTRAFADGRPVAPVG